MLPHPLAVEAGRPLNDVPSLKIAYTNAATGAGLLGQPGEIAVQWSTDGTTWTEARCRTWPSRVCATSACPAALSRCSTPQRDPASEPGPVDLWYVRDIAEAPDERHLGGHRIVGAGGRRQRARQDAHPPRRSATVGHGSSTSALVASQMRAPRRSSRSPLDRSGWLPPTCSRRFAPRGSTRCECWGGVCRWSGSESRRRGCSHRPSR